MQQRDIQDFKQISSFKRVVEPGIRECVIEIQNDHSTWAEFEKALLGVKRIVCGSKYKTEQ